MKPDDFPLADNWKAEQERRARARDRSRLRDELADLRWKVADNTAMLRALLNLKAKTPFGTDALADEKNENEAST